MRARRLAVLWSAQAAVFFCVLPALAQDLDMAVVVNENNHTESLTLAELRKVFVGERRSWAVGLPIKLIVRGPGVRERTVLLKLLGMSESEYKEYWIAEIFRGEADSEPLTLPTLRLEEKAVSIFPGGIAFVEVRDVKAGTRVLKLNGHLPGESGYPLH